MGTTIIKNAISGTYGALRNKLARTVEADPALNGNLIISKEAEDFFKKDDTKNLKIDPTVQRSTFGLDFRRVLNAQFEEGRHIEAEIIVDENVPALRFNLVTPQSGDDKLIKPLKNKNQTLDCKVLLNKIPFPGGDTAHEAVEAMKPHWPTENKGYKEVLDILKDGKGWQELRPEYTKRTWNHLKKRKTGEWVVVNNPLSRGDLAKHLLKKNTSEITLKGAAENGGPINFGSPLVGANPGAGSSVVTINNLGSKESLQDTELPNVDLKGKRPESVNNDTDSFVAPAARKVDQKAMDSAKKAVTEAQGYKYCKMSEQRGLYLIKQFKKGAKNLETVLKECQRHTDVEEITPLLQKAAGLKYVPLEDGNAQIAAVWKDKMTAEDVKKLCDRHQLRDLKAQAQNWTTKAKGLEHHKMTDDIERGVLDKVGQKRMTVDEVKGLYRRYQAVDSVKPKILKAEKLNYAPLRNSKQLITDILEGKKTANEAIDICEDRHLQDGFRAERASKKMPGLSRRDRILAELNKLSGTVKHENALQAVISTVQAGTANLDTVEAALARYKKK